MSKCIYKEIANSLNKTEVENYYLTHLPKDVCEHFGFHQKYFQRVFDYLNIPRRTASENTKIQFQYYDNTERNLKCGASHIGLKCSEETKKKISEAQKGISKLSSKNSSNFQKGHVPWNKGTTGLYSWTEHQRIAYRQSMDSRGWFNKSSSEIKIFEELKELYEEQDIIYQYSDNRYPFNCDFYVKSADLFIEVNYFWHHGPHPYDENSSEDVQLLALWKSKAIQKNQYFEAIKTWTQRDVFKQHIAQENNLHYIMIYPNTNYSLAIQ